MGETRNNDRQDRLRAALRENLKRRKQQARGRAGSVQEPAREPLQKGDTGPDEPVTDPAG